MRRIVRAVLFMSAIFQIHTLHMKNILLPNLSSHKNYRKILLDEWILHTLTFKVSYGAGALAFGWWLELMLIHTAL